MPHDPARTILITSGPTREYLDPVRYLSNASSGRMGRALAESAIRAGFYVRIVSGPVSVVYPPEAEVIPVITTEEMLARALEIYPSCIGAIGVAAPCDYRPVFRSPSKMTKEEFTRTLDSGRFALELEETPDIFAELGRLKRPGQWLVPFALETEDQCARALKKLARKNGDLIVVNSQNAIGATSSSLEILAPDGTSIAQLSGAKEVIAKKLIQILGERLEVQR